MSTLPLSAVLSPASTASSTVIPSPPVEYGSLLATQLHNYHLHNVLQQYETTQRVLGALSRQSSLNQ